MYGYRDPADYVDLSGLGENNDTYAPDEARYVAPEIRRVPGQAVAFGPGPSGAVQPRVGGATTVVRNVSRGQASRPTLPRSNVEAQLAEAKRRQAADIASILSAQQRRVPVSPAAEIPTTITRHVVTAAASGATPIVTTKAAQASQTKVAKKAQELAQLRERKKVEALRLAELAKQRELKDPYLQRVRFRDLGIPTVQMQKEEEVETFAGEARWASAVKPLLQLEQKIEQSARSLEKEASKGYIAPEEMRSTIEATKSAGGELSFAPEPLKEVVEGAIDNISSGLDLFEFGKIGVKSPEKVASEINTLELFERDPSTRSRMPFYESLRNERPSDYNTRLHTARERMKYGYASDEDLYVLKAATEDPDVRPFRRRRLVKLLQKGLEEREELSRRRLSRMR